jgi:hypothetical protein
MESSSDIESVWESDTEPQPETLSIQKKLIFNHKYIIIEDNKTYYGTCLCPESYLFDVVILYDVVNVGLKYFSEKDHFVDTHAKMD